MVLLCFATVSRFWLVQTCWNEPWSAFAMLIFVKEETRRDRDWSSAAVFELQSHHFCKMPRNQWNYVAIQMPRLDTTGTQGRWGRSRFLQDSGRMCVGSLREDWRCWKRWKCWNATWMICHPTGQKRRMMARVAFLRMFIQICKDFRRPDLIKKDLARTGSAFKQSTVGPFTSIHYLSSFWAHLSVFQHLETLPLPSANIIGIILASQFSEPTVCSSRQSRRPSSGAGTYLGQQRLKMVGDGWSMVR